jgi:hypothetical protein
MQGKTALRRRFFSSFVPEHSGPEYSTRAPARHSRARGNPILREHSKQMPVARGELGFPPARE